MGKEVFVIINIQKRIIIQNSLLEQLKEYHEETFIHSLRCTLTLENILNQFGFNGELATTMIDASLLHDYGKIFIPLSILDKPYKLTKKERAVMDTHAAKGACALRNIRTLSRDVVFLIENHHMPRTNSLPLEVSLLALVDIYDALKYRRAYKEPYTKESTFKIIDKEFKDAAHVKPYIECLKNL